MFSLLPQRVLHFPCYVEVYLDSKLERIFHAKIKIPKIFQSILCRMDKCNLFLSTHVLLFYALTILILHFVLFFSILSQKNEIFCQKERQCSVKLHDFFRILCRMDINFKRFIIYQSGITINISNT